MALTFAHGSDGSVTMPTGDFYANLNTWSCSLSRTTSVVTGFGDTGNRRRASAVIDLTGSAGGFVKYGAASTSPLGINSTTSSSSMVLTVASGATLTFDALVTGTDLSVTQDGDTTITFNFEMDDSDGPAVAWPVS